MLDVEYLVAPPHNDRPIVYCYRTGILRPQIKNALRESAARDGILVSGCEAAEITLVSHAPLFPGIAVCDWSKDKASASSELLPQALIALTTSEGCAIALFVRCDDELFRHPIWPEAKNEVSAGRGAACNQRDIGAGPDISGNRPATCYAPAI